jgi:uncharacterized protein
VAYEHSEESGASASTTIVISGGFGAGKTTFVGAVSELMPPLRTEALLSHAPAPADRREPNAMKHTSTVEMDFGRISLEDDDLVLNLFGAPGQKRFWSVWDDLARGAIGAIILADGRRLHESAAAAAFFGARNVPFLIAVNEFDDAPRHSTHTVRKALTLADHVPVITVDARDRHSAKAALIAVTEYSLSTLTSLPG